MTENCTLALPLSLSMKWVTIPHKYISDTDSTFVQTNSKKVGKGKQKQEAVIYKFTLTCFDLKFFVIYAYSEIDVCNTFPKS